MMENLIAAAEGQGDWRDGSWMDGLPPPARLPSRPHGATTRKLRAVPRLFSHWPRPTSALGPVVFVCSTDLCAS